MISNNLLTSNIIQFYLTLKCTADQSSHFCECFLASNWIFHYHDGGLTNFHAGSEQPLACVVINNSHPRPSRTTTQLIMVFHRYYVALFVYIDQLFCHCVFIYSNVHWRLVPLLHDGFLYCFCFLAESYETTNQLFGNYWMQATGILNYRLKYCCLKVICSTCQSNELEGEIKHATAGETGASQKSGRPWPTQAHP